MPRVHLPDGTAVNFPDGMGTDAINAELDHYWSQKHPAGTPGGVALPAGPAAHPAVDMKVPSVVTDLQNSFDAETTPTKGESLPKRFLKDMVGDVGAPVVHPIKTLKGAVTGMAIPNSDDIHKMETDPNKPTMAEGLTDAAAAGITGLAYGKLAEAAPEAIGNTLNKTGNLTKKVGAFTSRVGAGTEGADGIQGDTGRALAENRVVGLTPKSLAKKVGAKIGPASEARDTVLRNSTAGPTDISDATSPFDEIRSEKTDPVTGAAQPSAIKRLNTSQKAITHVADETGSPTGDAKETNLFPDEIGKLQKNVYGMTDYVTPDNDLANQGLKGTAAKLKAKLDQVAPEATPLTDNIHNLLSAEDQLKAKGVPGEVHGISQAVLRAGKMAKTGVGTAAGAGLDMLGNGIKRLGGAVRRAPSVFSPVSPEGPADLPSAQPARLGAGQPEEGGGSPGSMEGRPAPSVQTPPPPVKPRGLLEQVSGPGDQSPVAPSGTPHPGEPNPDTARMRVTPTEFAPQQGGNAFGHRKLIVGPDGSIRPAPIPLAAPPPQPQLESATGRAAPSGRPTLLSQLKADAERGAATQQAELEASRAKLAAVPEAKGNPPPPEPPPIPRPVAKAGSTRLPDPTDIDGWEKLVDEGKAHYDVHSHQYVFSGGKK